MINILIVDDEKDIVQALKIYLSSEQYNTFEAYTGRQALEILEREEIHLVLMDVMMPEMDGISALSALREKNNVPVILLTAKSEDADKIMGLNIGADDYVTKPFNPVELLARVRSQLRRYMKLGGSPGASEKNSLRVGPFELDDKTKTLTQDGEPVVLTPTEYRIMQLFMSRPGEVLSPKEIYRQAGYTPADVDTGAVIITGESARKENAAAVLENLSDFAGEFVASTAGPDLESVIAGKGSGACEYSRQTGRPVANLDIGGGTTNIAIFQDGQAVSRGCLDIGGRLIRLAPDWTVTRISPAARLCFSGGVADCMEQTGQDPLRYGDIGILLGQSLRPEETIRATVVGAGSYTTSVSGSTITYSEAALFPLKNLPVLRLTPEEQALCLEGRGEELEEKIRWFWPSRTPTS